MAVLRGEKADGKSIILGEVGAAEADTDFALARC